MRGCITAEAKSRELRQILNRRFVVITLKWREEVSLRL
jgi:hypothetical protein